MGLLAWLANNGVSIAESIFRLIRRSSETTSSEEEAKGKKSANLFSLLDRHKQLWNELEEKPELSRILKSHIDLESQPITPAEESFLNRVFIHFEKGRDIPNIKSIVSPRTLASDVRGFWRLPLPRAVWEKTKQFRNRRFCRFVERALKHPTHGSHSKMQ